MPDMTLALKKSSGLPSPFATTPPVRPCGRAASHLSSNPRGNRTLLRRKPGLRDEPIERDPAKAIVKFLRLAAATLFAVWCCSRSSKLRRRYLLPETPILIAPTTPASA